MARPAQMKALDAAAPPGAPGPADMPRAGQETEDFAAIFRAHAPQVLGLLRRPGIREADVQDVAQEVFVLVHRKLPTFEGRSSLRTWIIGIATRVAQNHRRLAHVRRERLQEVPEPIMAGRDGGPAEELGARETRAALLAALDTLDDKQRDVFVLYDVEGLEMAEVAATLGCPRFTGYTRLRAARKSLRTELQRLGHGRDHD